MMLIADPVFDPKTSLLSTDVMPAVSCSAGAQVLNQFILDSIGIPNKSCISNYISNYVYPGILKQEPKLTFSIGLKVITPLTAGKFRYLTVMAMENPVDGGCVVNSHPKKPRSFRWGSLSSRKILLVYAWKLTGSNDMGE